MGGGAPFSEQVNLGCWQEAGAFDDMGKPILSGSLPQPPAFSPTASPARCSRAFTLQRYVPSCSTALSYGLPLRGGPSKSLLSRLCLHPGRSALMAAWGLLCTQKTSHSNQEGESLCTCDVAHRHFPGRAAEMVSRAAQPGRQRRARLPRAHWGEAASQGG